MLPGPGKTCPAQNPRAVVAVLRETDGSAHVNRMFRDALRAVGREDGRTVRLLGERTMSFPLNFGPTRSAGPMLFWRVQERVPGAAWTAQTAGR
jgi:hypothetical protein